MWDRNFVELLTALCIRLCNDNTLMIGSAALLMNDNVVQT